MEENPVVYLTVPQFERLSESLNIDWSNLIPGQPRSVVMYGLTLREKFSSIKTPTDYRIQGVELMKEKTLQSMERCEKMMDPDDWYYVKELCLGMVGGCEQVIHELQNEKIPEKFNHIFID